MGGSWQFAYLSLFTCVKEEPLINIVFPFQDLRPVFNRNAIAFVIEIRPDRQEILCCHMVYAVRSWLEEKP